MIDHGEFAISPRHGSSTNTIEPEFIVGANYPWFHCGHDFGRDVYWRRPESRPDAVQPGISFRTKDALKYFRPLAGLGVKVMRWWILAAGINYPPSGDERRAAFDQRGEYFYPRPGVPLPVLDDFFLEDFRRLCRSCRAANLRLIPSLMSFEWFYPTYETGDQVSRGRGPLLFSAEGGGPPRMQEFLDATLGRLLEASRQFRDVIYAWELINEPEWAVADSGRNMYRGEYQHHRWTWGNVARADMCALINAALTMIQRESFLSTMGFLEPYADWLSDDLKARLRRDGANGRYIHQLHHYPTMTGDRVLPRHRDLRIKPCIVGEFPTGQGGLEHAANWPWDNPHLAEDYPTLYLRKRLELIEDYGYPMALFWSAVHSDSDARSPWTDLQRHQVAEFTGRRDVPR